MQAREENFVLENGKGLIEIRQQNNTASPFGLFIAGKPIALHWIEDYGSIGHNFYLVEYYSAEENLAEFLALVEKGFSKDKTLQHEFMPFLQNLVSGSYQIKFEDMTLDWRCCGGKKDDGYYGYYPNQHTFIMTQNSETLDEKRISDWIYAIGNGERPVVISISAGESYECDFILDGHHKLKAYERTKIPPRCLRILGSSTIPIQFTDLPEYKEHYPSAWKEGFACT
jgi:hypothetical protein